MGHPSPSKVFLQNSLEKLWQAWALPCCGLTCGPYLPSSHLDISRDRLSSYYKFKLTRKVLSLLVQKLGNLMSLDISGHMILENCSISKTDEEAGQTRWVPSSAAGRMPLTKH